MAARMDHFVPARTRMGAGFLDRYLPPLAANVVSACAEALTLPGDLILDPFCQSPAVAIGAVASGRRILASSPNPMDAFAVRQLLSPLPARQLNAAATRLGEAVRGGALLRDHIQNLYRCKCPSCRRPAIADYFVWDVEREEPLEKHVRCAGCGFQGSTPVQTDDLAVLEQVEEKGLTHFFVLDRMATAGDAARHDGEQLLKLYTPRARYALTQMIMKTEAEFGRTPEESALKYLILGCMVRCALFNPPPPVEGGAARRSGLGIERNAWLAYEEVWAEWRAQPPPPEELKLGPRTGQDGVDQVLPEKGGYNAAVLHCPIRDLARILPVQSARLILTGLSSASQRYWRLCFLWSGWLFGRDAAASLRPLVRQPIPDWTWYLRTLGASFRALRPKLHLNGHLAFLLSPRKSAQAEAAQMAAAAAGMRFASHVYGPGSVADASQGGGEYRIVFTKGSEIMEGVTRPPDPALLRREIKEEAERGALEAIAARGEPLPAGWLRNAAYVRLSQRGSLQRAMVAPEEGASAGYDLVRKMVDEALGKDAARPFSSQEWEAKFAADATIPMLWPQQPMEAAAPLGDRVEMAALQILRDTLMLSREDAEDAVYRQFPGLMTPERDLVDACLDSYGEEASPSYIRLRAEDQPERVRLAVGEVVAALETLGRRMGMHVIRDQAPYHALWITNGATYAFMFLPNAVIGPLADLGAPEEGIDRYLIVPDSRLALLRLKVRRSPIYGRILQQGDWDVIRQPHIQALLKIPQVDIHSLKQIVGLDPIIAQAEAQIPLF